MNPACARRLAASSRTRASTSRPSAPARSASSAPTATPSTSIVLDIWLPGLDGLTTLQRLRERQIDSQVVIISGHGNIESAVRAIKMGAFDFIEKPLSLEKTVLVGAQRAAPARSRGREPRAARQGRSPAAAHHGGGERADDAPARAGRDGGADQRPRADPRRERHRQGTGGAHHPPAQPAQERPVHRGELRRDSRGADRVGAVRPRARRVHRRRSPTSPAGSSRPTPARSSSTRSPT